MKKLFVTILALLYLGISTGAPLHLHYCMGKLVEMQLYGENGKPCDCGSKQKNVCKKDCCKHEQKLVKLEKDQKITESTILSIISAVATLPTYHNTLPEIAFTSITENFPLNNPPPESGGQKLFILNCLLLI